MKGVGFFTLTCIFKHPDCWCVNYRCNGDGSYVVAVAPEEMAKAKTFARHVTRQQGLRAIHANSRMNEPAERLAAWEREVQSAIARGEAELLRRNNMPMEGRRSW